jgi:N-acetylneuraminate synthase
MAATRKPLFAATGASNMDDVVRLMEVLRPMRTPVCLMQCNTNYTGSRENFAHIHLNVLRSYARMFPEAVLGLSDHTPGHATVLGAVALGARAVEKHFTDDCSRAGPDHGFSLDPSTWREMVERTRELELALGGSEKQVAENERDTVVLQRRSIRVTRDLPAGHVLTRTDVEVLRPAPRDGFEPWEIDRVLERKLKNPKVRGDHLRRDDV